MATEDLQTLRERYETLLRQYVDAALRTQEALGKPHALGSGHVPTISGDWIEAVEAERALQPEYEAARDAYWQAAGGR
ncbi:hypothetical protein V2S66_33110 [Streptomyces sp. V4-01]|uniref:Uncharacterized protein n=1 Tax=Actinacidiphila polyblastidii TaxID=3110430 RepID=A0ABU7PNJ8_9ACTN|nr:hypothetical protein [Streptomyces sp. V4-01]